MTVFLNARALTGGGGVAPSITVCIAAAGATAPSNVALLSPGDLQSFIHGKDVLVGTHGFNVNQSDGVECLAVWEGLLQLPATAVFVGLLWPGDSDSLYALSYPLEPKNAMDAGTMAGQFIDANFANASSVSFASHSLGTRVVLQAIATMNRRVRRAILMAGAVGDDCLTSEFAGVPAKVDSLSILASQQDDVLRWAFPVGDFAAELVNRDHPWWESALGRFGPKVPPPGYLPPGQIPSAWNYGHLDYLRTDPAAPASIVPPTIVPATGALPLNGAPGWQQAWSASFVSSRFR
ncbi:MAG TPA: alpha/beta hydrolase [Terracidiphilus sp.]|jgi:pimeloyl-ACP methyl ester carboxylesterase